MQRRRSVAVVCRDATSFVPHGLGTLTRVVMRSSKMEEKSKYDQFRYTTDAFEHPPNEVQELEDGK